MTLATLPALSGLGQTGIPPGGTCYDATHDPGEVHCSSLSTVVYSAIPLIGGNPATTTCSASEMACLAANPGAVGLPDVCSTYAGVSCGTLIGLLLGGLVLIAVIKK
jgi:hypothetical protein